MEQELLQLGTVAILFLLFMREFFAYLKVRKVDSNGGVNKEMLVEFRLLNENHLNDINNSIKDGNKEIVEAINQGNKQMIEILGRIDGRLDR